MGLFVKKPTELRQNLPYTVAIATRTKLIVGLGNPGKKYEMTRHNLGFMAVNKFASDNEFEPWRNSSKFKGQITEKTLGSTRVMLLKPETFMNLSEESALALASYYHIEPIDITAVHDELSIPFGQIRARIGGQAAGHNGVKSLIECFGTDFGRVRIGIKNNIAAKSDATDFVLSKLTKSEQSALTDLLGEVNGLLTEFVFGNQLPTDTRKILIA